MEIILNGNKITGYSPGASLSYEDISQKTQIFRGKVKWENPLNGGKGFLKPGESISVSNGLIINVTGK